MQDGFPAGFPSCTCIRNPTKKRNMNHTDFYARIRAIKEMEWKSHSTLTLLAKQNLPTLAII
ncbi:hypothetical protein DXB82_17895 [Phocaeicola vulgatus]|nr:hypothetical protein DXB90_18495 [Phocaeicola vulgatus]RGN01376.1 hypothetical protein DXB82_17895 [Phocaeicola vulgatus]